MNIQELKLKSSEQLITQAEELGNASAVLAASIFHYGTHSINEAKQYLNLKGIPVRI